MFYLYAVHNTGSTYSDMIYSFIPILSDQRKMIIKKYIHEADIKRSILAETLLKYILWKHLKIFESEIKFKYNEYGKPSLIAPEGVHFNISHSGDWVFCGVSDAPIGIDIEEIITDCLSIAKIFFANEEYDYICNQPLFNQYDTFCKIWTLKESYIKCIGKGLSIPLESFGFKFFGDKIRMYNNGILDTMYSFNSMKIDEKYYVSLCRPNREPFVWRNNINIITLEDLVVWKETIA